MLLAGVRIDCRRAPDPFVITSHGPQTDQIGKIALLFAQGRPPSSVRRKYHGGNSALVPLVETIGRLPPGFIGLCYSANQKDAVLARGNRVEAEDS